MVKAHREDYNGQTSEILLEKYRTVNVKIFLLLSSWNCVTLTTAFYFPIDVFWRANFLVFYVKRTYVYLQHLTQTYQDKLGTEHLSECLTAPQK